MNKLPPQRIVFFDLETTGIDPAYHQVIQIAACAYDCTRQVIIDECEMKLAFNWLDASPTALIINSFPIGAQRAGDQEIAYAESVVVGDLPPSHGTRFDLAYMEWLKSAVSPFDAITKIAGAVFHKCEFSSDTIP